MNKFVIADSSQCIGCRTCEIACSQAHSSGNSADVGVAPGNFFPRLRVVKTATITVPILCRQCENAACANACPKGAIRYQNDSIQVRQSACIGCKACTLACPYGAISLRAVPVPGATPTGFRTVAYKCDVCADRAEGPACVSVCPTGALKLMNPRELQQLQLKKQQAAALGTRVSRR